MSTHTATTSRSVVQLVLRVLTAGGLLVSAYVHVHLAKNYDGRSFRTSVLSQGDLFRAEAASALIVAVVLLFWDRWFVWLSAAAIGIGSFAAVMTYRYVHVGRIGIVPDMYEGAWFQLKTISAYAEGAVGLLVLAHFALKRLRARA